MKTKIGWFLIGFVSSWLAWSALRYILERPRDYMQHWNGPLRGAALRDPALGWLSNAYGGVTGVPAAVSVKLGKVSKLS